MGFADVVSKATATGTLKRALEQRFVQVEEILPMLPDALLRASSFAKLCPREEVLCSVHQIKRRKNIDVDLNLIFAHGKGLHWALQNDVLPATGMIIGIWSCLDCGKRYGAWDPKKQPSDTLVQRPKKCSAKKCESVEFLYREVRLRNEEYLIQGHTDGFLIVPGKPGVGHLEGKSIGQISKVRNAPDFEHVIQSQIYMWLSGLQWTKILYWEKGGSGLKALVEHDVEADPEIVTKIKNTITALREGLTSQLLPARICATVDCPRADKCVVSRKCFESP